MTVLGAELSLPAWFSELRPHQSTAIAEILDAYESGERVVVLDAPTGSGKSLVAEVVRQRLANGRGAVNGRDTRETTGTSLCTLAAYICTTKSLQDQVAEAFPYASVLKGRANYPTERYPREFTSRWNRITGDDCTKGEDRDCALCWSVHSCPYEQAKAAALRSDLAVLNTSYFLTEANGPGRFSGRELVIADECDLLESELLRYISVEISKRTVEQLGLGEPRYVTKEEAWKEWVEHAVEVVKGRVREFRESNGSSSLDIKQEREQRYLSRLLQRLSQLSNGLEGGGWIYTGRQGEVSFKPVLVDELGKSAFWGHSSRYLLMSATVISAEELLRSTGYHDSYRLVACPSTFKPANRPVIYRPTANMTKDGRENGEWDKMARGVEQVLAAHPNDRALVHCVSYNLATYLRDRVGLGGREGVVYTEAGDREAAIRRYRRSQGGVIFAASLDRGIDLPGEDCRVQVVAKVPFPNLGDRQVAARLYSPSKREGNRWYKVQAARTLVQMCGRAVRSEEDRATTYILDSQFERSLWGEWRHLFPVWWREALKWKC